MKKVFRFYKEGNRDWFVDIPEYPGEKADLQMVMGADTMLDFFAGGENEVTLTIGDVASPQEANKADILEFQEHTTEGDEVYGANYVVYTNTIVPTGLHVWLCAVTEYVFGEYPQFIFIWKN